MLPFLENHKRGVRRTCLRIAVAVFSVARTRLPGIGVRARDSCQIVICMRQSGLDMNRKPRFTSAEIGGLLRLGARQPRSHGIRGSWAEFSADLVKSLKTAYLRFMMPQNCRGEITALYGLCAKEHGFTDEDATRQLGILSAWTGLDLVCVWNEEEGGHCGGDSDYAVVVNGRLHAAPFEIFAYLWHEEDEPDISPDELRELSAGQLIGGEDICRVVTGRNWVFLSPVEEEAE